MTTIENPTWEDAFQLFNYLERRYQNALRRAAAAALVAEGAGEVGSSDINHYLYRRFCECGTWGEVLASFV